MPFEAAPAGTAIVVAARHDRENLVVSVRDEGSGPPAEIRDHLFEPFVTGRADGTGLGLSIVREVAVAHGGTARLRQLSRLEQSSRSWRHGVHPDRR